MPPPMGRTTPEGTAGITVSKTGGQGLSPRASQPKATARVQPENGMHGETQPRRTTEGGAILLLQRCGTALALRRPDPPSSRVDLVPPSLDLLLLWWFR